MRARGVAAALVAVAALGTGLPVSADPGLPQCLGGPGPTEPLVGDGSGVGDAPAGQHVPLGMGCWVGALVGPADVDAFEVVVGVHRTSAQVTAGCARVVFGLGAPIGARELCAGEAVVVTNFSPSPLRWTLQALGADATYALLVTPILVGVSVNACSVVPGWPPGVPCSASVPPPRPETLLAGVGPVP